MQTRPWTTTGTAGARLRRTPGLTLFIALVTIALLAAACGGGSADEPAAPAGTSAETGDGEAASADDDAAPSGTLRMGASTNAQTFDPQMAAVAQEYYLHPIFDTLVRAEQDGTYAAGLADSWEWIDQTSFEMILQPDVTFSDGTPMDAGAVVANFERGMALEASPSAPFYANIESVEATDDATVRLVLAQPTTDMLSQLSRLPGMMMSPASFDASPDTTPIGAGGWTRDAGASNPGEVEVYEANPDYWDPSRVRVETVEISILEADAATNAMLGGQVDVIELRGEADRATFASGDYQLLDRPNANVYYMQIMDTDGTLLEPMGDERVRRALNLAIDREAFNQGIQFGNGDPTPSFWLPGTPYYDESLEDLQHDPERAKELLAEAGYPGGFSVTFPSFGALTQIAEAVQQMWAEIGVDVTIEPVEPGALAAVMRDGTTVMTPTLARGFTAESHYQERLAPGGPYDPIGTDHGEIAELAETALTAETQEEQDEAWREVYTYAIEQGYLMTIGHQIPTVVVAPGVSGAEMRPSDNLPQPYGMSVAG